MSTEQVGVKNYRMSDNELITFTHSLSMAMTRDLTELASYGVTAAKITDMVKMADDFQIFPTDDILRADVSYAIEQRDAARKALSSTMRSVSVRAKAVFGEKSAKYRALNPGNITQISDSDFGTIVRQQHQKAVEEKTALAAEGVTVEYLAEFATAIDNFIALVDLAKKSKEERDDKAEARIAMGNALYALVLKYCDYGKTEFEYTSPSKYNDYIIYTPSAGGLKPPTGLKYLIEHNTAVWDAVENATSYELQYSPDGADWSEAYGGADNMVYYFPPQEGWAYFRCRARNANGYGEYSEVLKTGYYQILPPPSNIHAKIEENTDNGLILTWDEVPSAAAYKIYTSIVPIGEPESDFALLDKTSATKFTAELERGMRHYFQLVAENSAQTSLHSSSVHLDVEGALPS